MVVQMIKPFDLAAPDAVEIVKLGRRHDGQAGRQAGSTWVYTAWSPWECRDPGPPIEEQPIPFNEEHHDHE
jgi:hypothetical protein